MRYKNKLDKTFLKIGFPSVYVISVSNTKATGCHQLVSDTNASGCPQLVSDTNASGCPQL